MEANRKILEELQLINQTTEANIKSFYMRESKEEGVLEGMKKGVLEGIEKGVLEGIKKGVKKTELKIAAQMKLEGISPIIISKTTDLSLAEIEEL